MITPHVFSDLFTGDPVRDTSWDRHGACGTEGNPDWFTPEVETHGLDSTEAARKAKAICNGCPVIAACRVYGLVTDQSGGIWGGLDRKDRARILHPTTTLRPAA